MKMCDFSSIDLTIQLWKIISVRLYNKYFHAPKRVVYRAYILTNKLFRLINSKLIYIDWKTLNFIGKKILCHLSRRRWLVIFCHFCAWFEIEVERAWAQVQRPVDKTRLEQKAFLDVKFSSGLFKPWSELRSLTVGSNKITKHKIEGQGYFRLYFAS